MISECSGEDKATWRKAATAISCQAGTPLVLRHPHTTQNGGSPLPSLSHPHLHASSLLPQGSWQGQNILRGQVKSAPKQHGGEAMAPMRGHHSEERQPACFSVLRRLQLHNILPSIYLNPFLTIPHFYPFTFNSNPQAILKGWAAAWWHRPSSTGHLRVPQQCSDKLASCTWSWIRGLQS